VKLGFRIKGENFFGDESMGKPKPLTERIASIRTRREQLALKERQLAAKERSDKRKRDTRRKIVVGAAVLTAIEKDPILARMITRVLAASVGRAQDKEVILDLLSPVPLAANAPPSASSFTLAASAAAKP
jgi:hypothetical protein